MYKLWRSMNILSSSFFLVFKIFRFKFSVFSFFVFKKFRLQIFPSSNFGYFNRVAAHSTFHDVEAASLDGFLKEIQRKPRWAGYPIPLGRSRQALECGAGAFDEYYFVFNFFRLQIFRLQFFVFKILRFKFCRLQFFRFNIFSLQIFSSSNFCGIG